LTSKSKADRKVFAIAEPGREALAKASENIPEVSDETKTVGNWLNFDPNFLKTAAKLAPAINDIAKTGTRAQQEKATQVLEEARRQIHLILAEG
jgi:hypothetical protein